MNFGPRGSTVAWVDAAIALFVASARGPLWSWRIERRLRGNARAPRRYMHVRRPARTPAQVVAQARRQLAALEYGHAK